MFVGGGVAYKAIALGPQVEWEICNQGGNCSDCSCYNWNIPDRVLNKSPSGYCRQFTVTVNLRFSSFCEADIVRLHFPMGKLRNGEVKKLLALSWSLLLFSEWLIISLNTHKNMIQWQSLLKLGAGQAHLHDCKYLVWPMICLSDDSVFMVTDYMWSERERWIEHVTKVFIFGGWFYDDANNLGNIGW